MHDSPTQSSDRLDQIIGSYLRAQEQGNPPERDELLRQHPDLADELREFFANHDRLDAAAGGLPGELPRKQFVPPKVRYFGDYELLDEIARGGMGVVYRAKQTSLNRVVAIKMILSGHLAAEADVKRFRTEAEAAANLKHPGIVPVHEVGVHEGHHYFSMDYIEGRSLAEIVRENPLPARKAATYVRSIAQAVHYAHQQGTLHRDLKPSNILIDAEDHVHVTDFGLAVRVEGDSNLTRTGDILGTPAYMPPEQAQSKRGLIGPGSDVYALGAILYDLLTGRPPFRGESAVETLKLVVEAEPVSPRLLNPKVPRDLETICLKCLQKEPHKRYVTAEELSEELRRFLEGEPIRARPVGQFERAWRWCRRKPTAAGLLASILLLVVGVVGGALWYANDRVQQRLAQVQRDADEAQRLAVAEAEEANRVERLEQGITDAIANANLLREKSWELTERPTEWAAMLASARASYEHAVSLEKQEPAKIDPALHERLARLGKDLDADDRDQQLAVRSEEIRLGVGQLDPQSFRLYGRQRFPRTQAALAEAGLHVGVTPVDEAAGFLASRPAPVRDVWIGALDYGLSNRPAFDAEITDWLLAVLKAVDPGPWRDELRQAFVTQDGSEFARIAEQADLNQLSKLQSIELAMWLVATDFDNKGLSLLSRLHFVHPGDLTINRQAAILLSHSGRHEESLRYYYGALAARDDDANMWLNYGYVLEKLQDLDGAEVAYIRAIGLDANYALTHNNLGNIYHDRGETDRAAEEYRTAIGLKRDYAAPYINLGRLLYQQGDRDDAVQNLRTAVSLSGPDIGRAYLLLGETLEAAGDLPGAINAFQRAHARGEFSHIDLVAMLQAYTGDVSGYVATCRSFFDKFASSEAPAAIRALLVAHLLLPDGARPELLDMARRHVADNPEDAWILALAHYRLNADVDAWSVEQPETVREFAPHPRITFQLSAALLALRAGRSEDALTAVAEAREIQRVACDENCRSRPWEPERFLWLEVARELAAAGLDEIIPTLPVPPTYPDHMAPLIIRLRQTLDENPQFAPAYLNLGNALLLSGDLEGAIVEYQRATVADPEHARSYTCLGNAYQQRAAEGDEELAIAAFRTAAALLPEDPRVQADLGMTLRRYGRHADAIDALARVFELHPRVWGGRAVEYREFGECWIAFVKSCCAANQPERAIASLRQQIADQPQWTFIMELAELLHFVGDTDGYHTVCQSALADYSNPLYGGSAPLMLLPQVTFSDGEVTPELIGHASRIRFDVWPTYWLAGMAYHRDGQPELAFAELNKAAASPRGSAGSLLRDEDRIMSQLGLALVQLRRGNHEEAREAIIEARTIQDNRSDTDYRSRRQPWRAIPALWREVQSEMAQAGLVEPIANLAPSFAEMVIPDAEESGALVYKDFVTRDDLAGAVGLDISSDGRFVYAASHMARAITVFERDSDTGELTHRQTITRGDEMLDGVLCVELSHDDAFAATAAFINGSIVLLRRNADGTLTELDAVSGGKWDAAVNVAFSNTLPILYAIGDKTLAWYGVDEQRLDLLGTHPGENGCFDNVREVSVSPDGDRLYVTSVDADALTVLKIDPVTGAPTLDEVVRNGEVAKNGVVVTGLDGVFSVTCHEEFVYTSSGRFGGENALCVFKRGDDGMEFLEAHRNGLDGIQGLRGGCDLVISPDGLNLYVLGTTAHTIVCFERNPETGRLQYLRRLIDGIAGVGPLNWSGRIAISPDGGHVYAAADGQKAISIFERLIDAPEDRRPLQSSRRRP